MGKSKNIVETKSTKEKMKKNDNIPISSKISLFMYIYSMGVNMLMPLNILFCAYSVIFVFIKAI
ncbi:hypothetical protein A3Q56_07056 [Intoshia linei]|uniref:Uncharacterized protein n=1 Tax=Intoshia linei TaxID=1819745 RepID=A0A177ATB3_9BILA|nr:hypothetical protein A3Q56_07056 [Intoshia linei]